MELKMGMVIAFGLMVAMASSLAGVARGHEVTYDARSLIINGTRRILFSGSIHYPRSTPEMWPALISKAKQGGLDVIQTYVFWNVHERIQGQYYFEGRYDLVKFIKAIRDQGLFVSLRIGPFIESEWAYGGFPFWLREIPDIVFRSDNEPFKFHMQKFVRYIVDLMKSEGLYASQGGPIILSQIENEYQMVEPAFHEKGPPYVHWAASMVVSLQTGVPWMMCKQQDAPNPLINTCNGLNCGETFPGPNSPNKPALWTENWTSQYQVYGEEPRKRTEEDIAFAVTLFVAKNGSFVNYYMYHGGTNFGRSASSYVIASYYDDAPLDEYGLISQPKWGHLKELHAVIKAASEPLLFGTHTSFSLGPLQEAHVFQSEEDCVGFLINSDLHLDVSVQFRDDTYTLPKRSISILSDCKHVSFNTANVRSQNGVRSAKTIQSFDKTDAWEAFREEIPSIDQVPFKKNMLVEQMATTRDETDYLWYTVSYDCTSPNDRHVLHVTSKAHVIHAFVNGVLVGSAHGSHGQQTTQLEKLISLSAGQNKISFLSVMVGLPDGGAYMEKRVAGLSSVSISNDKTGTVDLSDYQWGYKVGLTGEEFKAYTQGGSRSLSWRTIEGYLNQPLTWYKTTFNAPSATDPVALNLASMGKGEAWINGQSIGRYWVSFKTPLGRPSQYLYHVPRYFLKPSGNLLVLFEEMGGNPLNISVNTMSVSQVCSKASDSNSTYIMSRRRRPRLHLRCHEGRRISAIEFASYGSPQGDCENYSIGSCHSFSSKFVAEMACIGKRSCAIPLSPARFGGDPCPGSSKSLMVVAKCS